MRKALIDVGNIVQNLVEVAVPRRWTATPVQVMGLVEVLSDSADPQSPMVSKEVVIQTLLTIADHGMNPFHGPLLAEPGASGVLPTGLDEVTAYFARVLDADMIDLSDAYRGKPIAFGGESEPGFTLTEAPYDPPPGLAPVDNDGTAEIGGSYDPLSGTFAAPPPPPPPLLDDARVSALTTVDADAETARHRFITPGDGQVLTYDAKRREAEAWAADDAPDPANYPWARAHAARLKGVAEADVTVAQCQAVIDEWTARVAAWVTAGIEIEHVREGAKDAINIAADIAAIDTVLDGLVWPAPA